MEPVKKVMETAAFDLGALLDAADDAVVTLVAGDTRLVAHRAVLVERSQVFAAMFRHEMLESSSGLVTVSDVEGPVLRQLLAYLYTLQPPQLPGMAPQLLAAADKYGVSALKAACEQQVAAQLTVETAAAAAALAVRHSCASLQQAAIAYVKAHLVEVMATRGWADTVRMQPEDVVEVSRLVSQPPAETSAPAPADSGPSPHAATQPHSGDHSDSSLTPASAAPATAASHSADPPDDAAVSRLRSLSAAEKGTRLIEAAKEGAVGELEALLAAGADVGATDGYRRTALHCVAYRGHVEAARRLVARGAALEARGSGLRTPLHWATYTGHAAVVRLLLDSRADHSARDAHGWTPLHYAAANGKAGAAAALLEAGADRAATDDRGRTPLDLAMQYNTHQLVHLLRET